MTTDNYKWWEEVQSKLHQQFNDIRLSPEHILWLSENFERTALSGVGEEEKECEYCKDFVHVITCVCGRSDEPKKEIFTKCPDCIYAACQNHSVCLKDKFKP